MNCYGCPLATVSCPIGTLQHFVLIKAVPFMLLGFLFVIGTTVGRMACGWVCPFGFFQEWLYKIKTQKFHPKKFWKYGKYFVLVILTLVIAYALAEPWFCKLCPVGTLEAGIPLILWNPNSEIFSAQEPIAARIGTLFLIKIIILIGIIGGAIVIKRAFCRYVCPLGAIFSLFNRFSFLKLKVENKFCNSCENCRDKCPMDINVYESTNDADCIRCLKCTECQGVSYEFRLK